jgi:hypothetical protein
MPLNPRRGHTARYSRARAMAEYAAATVDQALVVCVDVWERKREMDRRLKRRALVFRSPAATNRLLELETEQTNAN